MSNKELLSRYTATVMELQEEYLKERQDFNRQKDLEENYSLLRKELLSRMEAKHGTEQSNRGSQAVFI